MAIVVPNIAEQVCIKYIINKQSPTNLVLRLYTNDHDPTENTTLVNLTEATEAGYAAITLTGATWTVTTLSGVTTAEYPTQTFTITVAGSFYGVYITNGGGELILAERFPNAPFNLPSGGGEIAVTPKVSLD